MVSDSFAKKLLSKSEWALYQGINAAERSVLVRKSPEFSCIVQRLDNVMDQLSAGYLVDSNNETIRAIQQHLLQDIVVMVGNAKPETLRINSNHRLLYRASRIVMDCRTRPISVDELAKRVGTSRRNLEHLFRSIVGLSPKQFMLNVRLNRIREDLVHKTTNNVMGIAKRYGIKHLGHFSSAYKSVFKELPSETRARASTLTG